MHFRAIILPLALAIPATSSAVSVDWACKTVQALHVGPYGKLVPTDVEARILSNSFVVDYGSGRMFGKGAPVQENVRVERMIVASSAYDMADYFVVWLFEGHVRSFLIASGHALSQKRNPFTFMDSTTNTIFTGTCVLGLDP